MLRTAFSYKPLECGGGFCVLRQNLSILGNDDCNP